MTYARDIFAPHGHFVINTYLKNEKGVSMELLTTIKDELFFIMCDLYLYLNNMNRFRENFNNKIIKNDQYNIVKSCIALKLPVFVLNSLSVSSFKPADSMPRSAITLLISDLSLSFSKFIFTGI